jgi:lipoprotein-anchoring transpeptidase ErfK/SrfK
MSGSDHDAFLALSRARDAYNCGESLEARRYASDAIQIDPNLEEAWLILAALGTPQASVAYLTMALRINPHNIKAQQELVWAYNRLENDQSLPGSNGFPADNDPIYKTVTNIPGSKKKRFVDKNKIPRVFNKLGILLVYSFFLMVLMVGFCVISILLNYPKDTIVIAKNDPQENSTGIIKEVTQTPLGTSTPLPTSTISPIPTITITMHPTRALTFTSTPTFINTNLPMLLPGVLKVPDEIEENEKWIDVNVSSQTIYAMEGSERINSFRVSTGKQDTPTVGGKFHIYDKLVTASMSGEDYYYPEIPYVMYFYQGYGFHGVTWPLKLGVPSSYGCVNMLTPDAEWLFNWADVGTLINVHY